jgi:tetratricopeptide (TPR) repeat protein
MAVLAYVTEACGNDARSHNCIDALERQCRAIEEAQSAGIYFDRFPQPYLVKKQFGGRRGRLIAIERQVGEHTVVVFLAVMIRGDRDYASGFSQEPEAYGKRFLLTRIDEQDLITSTEERTRVGDVPAKPVPSDTELLWLYGMFSHRATPARDGASSDDQSQDMMVFETGEWVSQVNEDRVAKFLALIAPVCLGALDGPAGLHWLEIPNKSGWGIWVNRSVGRLLLTSVVAGTDQAAAEAAAKELAARIEAGGSDALLRASRRAYPALILAVEELWLDLEKETTANMALSPEESEILEAARQSPQPFPLFINGRAGSGKSTILQYLFADLLFTHLGSDFVGRIAPPLYLTANGALLRSAREFVSRLLEQGADYLAAGPTATPVQVADVLGSAFQEFQPFLLSLLSPDDCGSKFNPADRVDYARFRRMWEARFGRDRVALQTFGPDLSWHVIRTYIKGTSAEDFLDVEDYAHLPENQLTVTSTTFQTVFERVWLNWYSQELESNLLWDDQDLARHILKYDLAKPTWPGIFCDEAQDFTRLELEILLRLNLYSDRSLPPEAVQRVPFVFAGDQFQTLNPTGFRWDSIKAAFTEKFIFELDPARRTGRAELNYRELQFNYRSTEKIVKFSNHVQALRSALFDLPALHPQRPWASDVPTRHVSWFRANDGHFWSKFDEDPTRWVIVVPCSEGEESDYVTSDPILSEHVPVENGVPRNVLSSARAKGCEYPAVIVYGFGSASPANVVELLTDPEYVPTGLEASLPLQYFVNRLYVAVSRPKRQLVVVDSETGLVRLWHFARDDTAVVSVLDHIKHGQNVWGEWIEGMALGQPRDLEGGQAEDPRENAKAFEEDGIARNDPFLLNLAATAYRSVGDLQRSRECRARALEADQKFLEAGQGYLEARMAVPQALRCLWRAGDKGWKVLRDATADFPQLTSEIEHRWAVGSSQSPNPVSAVQSLGALLQRLKLDKEFAQQARSAGVWPRAIEGMISQLFGSGGPLVSRENAIQLLDELDGIGSCGLTLPERWIGEVCFLAGQTRRAIEYWDRFGDTKSQRYLQAKSSIEAYPNVLEWLDRLEDMEGVIAAYEAHPLQRLKAEHAAIVANALRAKERLAAALSVHWRAEAVQPMFDEVVQIFRGGNADLASRGMHAAIRLAVTTGHWRMLKDLCDKGEFTPSREWKDKAVRAWVKSIADDLRATLVRTIARLDIREPDADGLQAISAFHRDWLRVKGRQWERSVSLTEAGAAFERLGRIVDAIQYYEALHSERLSADDTAFARLRWFVVKDRQLAHERERGNGKRAKEIEEELLRRQENWRLKAPDQIDDFPLLPDLPEPSFSDGMDQKSTEGSQAAGDDAGLATPPIDTPVTLQPEVSTATTSVRTANQDEVLIETSRSRPTPETIQTATLGVLRLELSRANGRCNISHAATLDQVSIRWSEQKVRGDVDFKQQISGTWVCDAWGLVVSLPQEGEELLVLTLKDARVRWSALK